ncbi:MAG: aminotransferase class V-fold PLP-dependent enzyme [Saprospiraceae bacterium]|nr:aminotransferase class V-fold PLP-dependent enzyme [Saprospiraceae bacterium]
MIEKIKSLEVIARSLDPKRTAREDLWQQTQTYVEDFLEHLDRQKGYLEAECPKLSDLVIREEGGQMSEVLNIMRTEIDHAGITSTSGRHLGYIPGGAIWVSALGDLMAAVSNKYAGIYYASPGAVLLENQLIRWLCELIGFPSTAHGNLSSGGSIASLIALTTAREVHQIRSHNIRKSVIYYTPQMHHCLNKAIQIVGLGECICRLIPVNDRFEMDTGVLRQQLEQDVSAGLSPFLIIATAGTTDTGAVDPLEEIAEISRQYSTWYHVDAAYGGFFLLVDEMKEKLKGIGSADSVVMDPHKGLFLPFGTGVILIKDGQALVKAHTKEANYLIDAYGLDEISPADCSPELTKHFRGLRMWLPLHLYGLQAFRACLEEKIFLCRYFHEEIQQLGFEVGPPPALSVTLFRYPDPEPDIFNKALLEAIHKDGRYFMSSTRIEGALWIRCAVLNFRTHLQEIQGALQMITDCLATIKQA